MDITKWIQYNPQSKFALRITLIAGMICHLFVYTNIIPNYDGISRLYDEQQMTISGRWFLHYATYLDGFIIAPMVAGVIVMLFLGQFAAIVTDLLNLKSKKLIAAWSVIAVVYTSVAYTNTFTFTAAAYSFAVFLSAFSVWIAVKSGKYKFSDFVWSCLILAVSMGIYQVYAALAIGLCILLLIQRVIQDQTFTVGELWKKGMYMVLYLIVSAILYYGFLMIFLKVKGISLISYRGMDDVAAGLPVTTYLQAVIKTYKGVITGLLFVNKNFNTKSIVLINLIIGIGIVVMALYLMIIKKIWSKPIMAIQLLLLFGIMPIAMNFGQVLSPLSSPSPTMNYAFVFFYLLLILLLEEIIENGSYRNSLIFRGSICCMILLLYLFGYQSWKIDNQIYTVLNQSHKATLGFMTNLLGRIESTEGYRMGMDVMIIGGFPEERYCSGVEGYDNLTIWGITADTVVPRNKHIYLYFQDWLNTPIYEPAEEELMRVSEEAYFKEMPLYPDDGSVRIEDGKVIVKLQEIYTPKERFEIEYENRK